MNWNVIVIARRHSVVPRRQSTTGRIRVQAKAHSYCQHFAQIMSGKRLTYIFLTRYTRSSRITHGCKIILKRQCRALTYSK